MIVNNVSIIPDPPEKGKKLTVTVYFNLSEWYTHIHTHTSYMAGEAIGFQPVAMQEHLL